MRLSIPLLLFLLLAVKVAAVEFSEVMYNPPGNDNNQEYVEVLGNLSDVIVGDLSSNDSLTPLFLNASNPYALIVEEDFDFSGLHCNIYSAGATIGNNLNNGGDTIHLYRNGSLVANFSYDGSLASSNGHSLSRSNESWVEGLPTPCEANIMYPIENDTDVNETTHLSYDLSLTQYLPSTIYQGLEYDSLFKIRNEAYKSGESGYVNATVRYTLMQENRLLTNDSFRAIFKSYKTAGTGMIDINETGNYTLCGEIITSNVTESNPENDALCFSFTVLDPFTQPCNISLGIRLKMPQRIYESGEAIKFYNRIYRHDNNTEIPPYIIRYEIEDLFGEKIRMTTTENTNQKSWTPKIKEEFGVFLLKNSFDLLACNNSNRNVTSEQLLVVKGAGSLSPNESSLEIELPEKPAAYGDEVLVTIKAYKGDTRKYSIKAWIEDGKRKVSSVSTFHAKKPFTEYEMVLPIELEPEGKSGQHRIVVEGLGLRREKTLWIQGTKRAQQRPLEIASFYTRSKKVAPAITLAARLTGEDNVTWTLIGLHDYAEGNIGLHGQATLRIPVEMRPGANPFILRITKEGTSIQERSLLLEMTDEIREVEQFTVAEETTEKHEEHEKEELADGTKKRENLVTGDVTFADPETSSAAPILFATIGLLLLGLLLQQRQ